MKDKRIYKKAKLLNKDYNLLNLEDKDLLDKKIENELLILVKQGWSRIYCTNSVKKNLSVSLKIVDKIYNESMIILETFNKIHNIVKIEPYLEDNSKFITVKNMQKEEKIENDISIFEKKYLETINNIDSSCILPIGVKKI